MSGKVNLRKVFSLVLITIVLLTIMPGRRIQAQDALPDIGDYYFHSSWGGEGKQLLQPEDVALGPDGKIYIVNYEYNRITIVDNEGFIYREIGGFGEEDGKFDSPQSIAVNDAGEIFVSDTFNRRLQKFDSTGNHLLTFGTFGEGEGEIFAPQGIAFAANGDLLVVDSMNKIVRYSQNGDFISEWGKDYSSSEPDSDDFYYPTDVAVDDNGMIYVADHGNYRIQIYDSTETYIGTIDVLDDDVQVQPEGVALDSSGQIYVTGNDKIFIFGTNETGNPLVDTWDGGETGLGFLGEPTGIFIDQVSGEVYVAERSNNRVTVFTSSGQVVTAFGTPELVNGYFYNPQDTSIANNQVYVTDTSNNRIQVFNLDGTFIDKWGEFGSENGQFDEPQGVDSDTAGNIYITDTNNLRVQKFDASGNWLDSFDLSTNYPDECTSDDLICRPYGITIDQNDNLFITVNSYQGAHGIMKLSNTGGFQALWPVVGGSIATDSAGNVYTTWGAYIYKYTNDGELLNTFGEGPGPYRGYRGLEIDQFGDIYTMSTWLGYLEKYSSEGALLGTFGQKGNEPGEFAFGSEMAITDDGKIYIADVENQRVQIIAPTLPDPDPESGLILNGNFGSSEIVENSGKVGLMKLDISSNLDRSDRDSVPGLEHWVYGGSLPVERSDVVVSESFYSMQLGEVVTANAQGISDAWSYQVFFVRPEWLKPVLTFNYNIFTNDAKMKSNFIVEIQDGVGLNNLEVIVLDGFEDAVPGEVPAAGTELGWKSVEFDLSPYRGQHIRLAFASRNLYPSSLGIWSYVEKVEVKDEASKLFLPLMLR